MTKLTIGNSPDSTELDVVVGDFVLKWAGPLDDHDFYFDDFHGGTIDLTAARFASDQPEPADETTALVELAVAVPLVLTVAYGVVWLVLRWWR